MKRYNKSVRLFGVILSGVFLLANLASCSDDVLDTKSETKILSGDSWGTSEQILAQVYGLYSTIKDIRFYGGAYHVYGELRGEEFVTTGGNTGDGTAIWQQNALASADQVSFVWAVGYTTINNANLFIDAITPSTVINDELKKNYIAEAKYLRAYAYFGLVQVYSRPYWDGNGSKRGLPLRLTGNSAFTNGDLAPVSVGKIYEQILQDLDAAETDLPESYSSAALYSTRAHKATAIALKTRVYLVKGEYDKVVTEAAKLVPDPSNPVYTAGAVTHRLESSLTNIFSTTNVGTYTGPEAILTFPFNNDDKGGSQRSPAYFYNTYYTINDDPIASIVRKESASVFANASDSRSNFVKGNKFVKYQNTSFLDYIPAIRYAEVLLNYAEASARTSSDLTTAITLLNVVRHRSNSSWTFDVAETSDKDVLVETILNERRIELFGEGFRVFDLSRLGKTLPAKGTVPSVEPDFNNYVWPIPASEASTNLLINNFNE
ncbi:MAG: RagB/SusD family nutrient uptake outer membrane protein [Tannerella sp.]|jgi:hypothetical protein|nr:RagB/SusD family nutrient uptake outer membrane protein [Tannerella sp.]